MERRKYKHYRPWVVSLTERYEVRVLAATRREAISAVTEFGRSGPVRYHIAARRGRWNPWEKAGNVSVIR